MALLAISDMPIPQPWRRNFGEVDSSGAVLEELNEVAYVCVQSTEHGLPQRDPGVDRDLRRL